MSLRLIDRAFLDKARQAWKETRNFGLELAVGVSIFLNEGFFFDVGQYPDDEEPQRGKQNADQRSVDERPAPIIGQNVLVIG